MAPNVSTIDKSWSRHWGDCSSGAILKPIYAYEAEWLFMGSAALFGLISLFAT